MGLPFKIAVIFLLTNFVSTQILVKNTPSEDDIILSSRDYEGDTARFVLNNYQRRGPGVLLIGSQSETDLQYGNHFHTANNNVLDKTKELNVLPASFRIRRCSTSEGRGAGEAKALAGVATGAGGSLNFVGGIIGYLFGLRNVQAGAGIGAGLGAEGGGRAEGGSAICT